MLGIRATARDQTWRNLGNAGLSAELRWEPEKAALVEAEERRKLAQELHDGVSQLVAGALLEIRGIEEAMESSKDEAVLQRVQIAEGLLSQAVAEIHCLTLGLRPPDLQRNGLIAALDHLVTAFAEVAQIGADLTIGGHPRALRAEEAITVFRFIQEALNNVRKHAAATSVEVHLDFGPSILKATVSDNGKGFQARDCQRHPAGRLGLVGMQERAQSIGARVWIQSTVGAGSRVSLEMPLRRRGLLMRLSELAERISRRIKLAPTPRDSIASPFLEEEG